jgi:hypothetical protein
MPGSLSCGVCLGIHGESFSSAGEDGASAPREKAEEDVEGEAFVLPVGRGEDGISGAEVARFLGATISAVVRAAYAEELAELPKYP